jgi:hypothetical protein
MVTIQLFNAQSTADGQHGPGLVSVPAAEAEAFVNAGYAVVVAP